MDQHRHATLRLISELDLLRKLQRGDEDYVLVDARDAHVYDRGTIKPKGSVRISPGEPDGEIEKLPRDKLIITV
ncbi:MAG: hypothetical protein HYX92_07755 [Chloroflexi bacterium]|nr:hypothetical protein [Chloroflexota bacterium]